MLEQLLLNKFSASFSRGLMIGDLIFL